MPRIADASEMAQSLRGDKDITVTGSFGDDVLANELFAQSREAEPVVPRGPAPLPIAPPGVFRFRSKDGRRNPAIKLRVYRPLMDDKLDADGKKRYERWAARTFGGGDIRAGLRELKMDREVYDELGEYYIQFTPIDGEQQAFYETDNALVASYIRMRLPEFPFLYEEVQPVEVVLASGERAFVVPADDVSRQKMAESAAGEYA